MCRALLIAFVLCVSTSRPLKAVEILSSVPAASKARPVIGEVLEFGTFHLEGATTTRKTTPDGQTIEAPEARFTHYTDVIEAKPGIRFGFRFRVRNLPDQREVVFRTVVRHPAMRLPSGETRDHYETETRLPLFFGSVTETTGYGLDHAFEQVPGRWTFEHWHGAKLVVSQSFTVLTPEAAAERQRKIAARLEAWRQLPKMEWDKPLTVEEVVALACNLPRFYSHDPGSWFVQTKRRTAGFWSGGQGYEFEPGHAPIWKAVLSDETASMYGRMIAAGYLLRANDPAARDFLKAQIDSFYRRYTHNAAQVLAWEAWRAQPDPWLEDCLIQSIQDERLIGGFGSSSSIPGAYQLFVEGDLRDLMCSTYSDVCFALGRMKSRRAIPVLLTWLDSIWVREGAIDALGDIGDETVAPNLMKLLETDDELKAQRDARIITALGKLHYRPLVPWLIRRMDEGLKSDPPNQEGGEESLAALLKMKAREAIPTIHRWVDHPKIYFRPLARRVLAHLENEDSVPALLQLLADERDEYAPLRLIDDLAKTRSARTLQPLIEVARTSRNSMARRYAMRALGDIGSDESLRALVELSRADYSGWDSGRSQDTPHKVIASVLTRATGQKFELDFAAWEKWLRDHPGFPAMEK